LEEEEVFRIILLLLWICLFAIRMCFAARLRRGGDRVSVSRRALKLEGFWVYVARTFLFFSLIVVLLVYSFVPQWMGSFLLPLPSWVRWAGTILGLLCLPFLVWVQQTLGRHWSTDLQIRERHVLVTQGPYRWVRHPMYSLIFLFLISLCLVSANWLFVVGSVAAIALLYGRIAREEQMMIERFGEEYCSYMGHTGRLLPRLARRNHAR